MVVDKDVRKIIKSALKRGWVLYRNSKHLIYKYKNGKTVIVSSTPSNKNACKMIEKDFRNKEKN